MERTQTSRRARFVLEEHREGEVVLSKPGTSYRLHLTVLKPLRTEVGKRTEGVVRVQAKRVDVVGTGGAYIEPVYGSPRRIQGMVLEADAASGSLTVDAGIPVVATLVAGQRAEAFEEGQFVTFEVAPGASFTAV
jgi:hypothetical protein